MDHYSKGKESYLLHKIETQFFFVALGKIAIYDRLTAVFESKTSNAPTERRTIDCDANKRKQKGEVAENEISRTEKSFFRPRLHLHGVKSIYPFWESKDLNGRVLFFLKEIRLTFFLFVNLLSNVPHSQICLQSKKSVFFPVFEENL